MSGAGELAMFLAAGAVGVALLFGPIGSAIARRIGGRHEPDETQRIEEIGASVTAEVEELRSRLTEMEERLDFAERVLAHGPPEKQLGEGANR
jgi:hypothetical protein